MQVLVVSATASEIKPLLQACGANAESVSKFSGYTFGKNEVDILITGVGMVHTSFYLGLTLQQKQYSLAVNAGICGSFNKQIEIGEVVNVVSDYFPEIGIEDGVEFKSLFDLDFLTPDEFPYSTGKLINESIYPGEIISKLRKVSGVTINTVHGKKETIEKFVQKHPVDIESMEGAAFLFACMNIGIPCLQLRSVSNFIEQRNISNWNIPLAVRNLNDILFKIFNDIS
jgi:futalosine hydrolase